MCTLTGAQGISTGQRHAAIMSSDAALEQEAMSAGKRCGNLTFPVPYCPELFSQEFASSVGGPLALLHTGEPHPLTPSSYGATMW